MNEKKIKSKKEFINYMIKNILAYENQLNGENDPKKIEKLTRKINGDRASIQRSATVIKDNGGDIYSFLPELNEEQARVLKEALPEKVLSREEQKTLFKENLRIETVKAYLAKAIKSNSIQPTPKDIPIKEKVKYKSFKDMCTVADLMAYDKNRGWDYETEKDTTTAFTKEELAFMQECVDCYEERLEYLEEKVKIFRVMSSALIETGEAIGEAGRKAAIQNEININQKKINVMIKFFEGIIKDLNKKTKIPKDNLRKMAKDKMKRFKTFIADDTQYNEIKAFAEEFIAERNRMFTDVIIPEDDILNAIFAKFGFENAQFYNIKNAGDCSFMLEYEDDED